VRSITKKEALNGPKITSSLNRSSCLVATRHYSQLTINLVQYAVYPLTIQILVFDCHCFFKPSKAG